MLWLREALGWILAALGAEGVQVRVEVEGQAHPRGSEVLGCVVVEGGPARQRTRALDLRLVEYGLSDDAEGRHGTPLRVDVLATDLDVLPYARHRYPFALRLPDDALLTMGGAPIGPTDQGVQLAAQAYVPYSVDPVGRAALQAVVQPEVVAAYEAMSALGFVPAGPLRRPGTISEVAKSGRAG